MVGWLPQTSLWAVVRATCSLGSAEERAERCARTWAVSYRSVLLCHLLLEDNVKGAAPVRLSLRPPVGQHVPTCDRAVKRLLEVLA